MEKRALLALIGLAMAFGCGDDSGGGVTAGTAATPTAGGMAVGVAGTTAAAGSGGSATAGSSAGAAGAAAGTGAAGRAAAGTGAAGMLAAGATAGMGTMAGTGAAGIAAGGAGGMMTAGTGGASGGAAGTGGAAGGGGGAFTLTSTAVMNNTMLPAKYRCMGSVGGPTGPNPPLAWSGAPAGTMSFALLLRDRTFNNYQHWTIYDIPASVTSLPEGVPTGAMPAMPAGAKQANNALGLTGPGYYGPCGSSGTNTYEFVLYALSVPTLQNPGMSGMSVETALEMVDLGKASLTVMSSPP